MWALQYWLNYFVLYIKKTLKKQKKTLNSFIVWAFPKFLATTVYVAVAQCKDSFIVQLSLLRLNFSVDI